MSRRLRLLLLTLVSTLIGCKPPEQRGYYDTKLPLSEFAGSWSSQPSGRGGYLEANEAKMALFISPDGECHAFWTIPRSGPYGDTTLSAKFKLNDSGAHWTVDIPSVQEIFESPVRDNGKPRQTVVAAPMRGEYDITIKFADLPRNAQILSLVPAPGNPRRKDGVVGSPSPEWTFKRIVPSDVEGKGKED
jgi:hypothetical protein